jgi:ABC-2 type transport system permease protein
MTASTISGAGAARVSTTFGPFAGFRALFRKDTTEWLRGKRAWVVLAVSVSFMLLAAANAWIIQRVAAGLPAGEISSDQLGSLAPADNLLVAIGAQIFVIATIFVVGSQMAREREAGTLAWVASKPVTRASIWTSKWVSSTAMLSLVAGIVPLAATAALVTVLYGAPPIELVVGLAAGIVAVVAFFAALGLGLGTVLPGQAATIAAVFAVFALLPIIANVLPFDIEPFLPTSMLAWPTAALSGAGAHLVTPIAWVLVTGGIAALAIRRMGRMEL